MKKYKITAEPINNQDVIDSVVHHNAGAISVFIGTVREMTGRKQTKFLHYEAYVPMAEKQLERIGLEIQEKWPSAIAAITHRIGTLQISDIAVTIAVSTPHRQDAFEASRYAIERIKEIVPIWKKEHYSDGEEWVGNQQGTKTYPAGHPEEVVK
ncbi:molybdenum cofactor biosynthesis protein MoaE [Fictibacillus phosphorivorans]|uniref:Molybdopterin synthase catalytic subunit n=1 Tax=Fictibacillus phosphorivorans TaxID=1221500 RepID=A0A160ILX4_9BACL|nr:molybdenum cofactor biosynthesis protein MoaE [Fictibacillus phosphorivorans]ANC76630.1 molybdenum cofactor biosynthesis protein MoaE [Fictibacillus phosphorivorans]